MKAHLFCLTATMVGFILLPSVARAQTTVTNTTYSSGSNVTVNGPTTVATSGTVAVDSGAIVKFRASGTVTLLPGFHAASGSSFRAFIFADADGDGMDDLWESANGLNPASAADAATDLDGDGVPNLAEYLLGTKPNSARQDDTNGATQLKINRPRN